MGAIECPLGRITVYWCDGTLGIHYDGNSGTWSGMRKRPEEYVRADLYDAMVAERDADHAAGVRAERERAEVAAILRREASTRAARLAEKVAAGYLSTTHGEGECQRRIVETLEGMANLIDRGESHAPDDVPYAEE